MTDHRIRPGQVYESCHPLDEGRRIRVISEPWGGRVDVETVTATGRGARSRSILTAQLHASTTTHDDKPRRTGYRLVTDAPANPPAPAPSDVESEVEHDDGACTECGDTEGDIWPIAARRGYFCRDCCIKITGADPALPA